MVYKIKMYKSEGKSGASCIIIVDKIDIVVGPVGADVCEVVVKVAKVTQHLLRKLFFRGKIHIKGNELRDFPKLVTAGKEQHCTLSHHVDILKK